MKTADKPVIRIDAIDDDLLDLEQLKRVFSQISSLKVELSCFTGWDECRSHYFENPVDMLFLDFFLGARQGSDIIREIRGRGDLRPIVVFTGDGSESVVSEIFKAGADDYMQKDNISSDSLRITILGILERLKTRDDRILLEKELQQSQKLEALGALSGGLAHDVKNFLTPIIGMAELTLQSDERENIDKYQREIISICQNMEEMVGHLMNFARRGEDNLTVIDLRETLDNTQQIIRHTIPRSILISGECRDEGLFIKGSAGLIHQMIINLCINASDAMNGRGTLSISCAREPVRTEKILLMGRLAPGDYAVVRISDTGSGIEDKLLKHIFEPLFTTKGNEGKRGTGLGLSMVYNSMVRLDGMVDVSSKVGEGSEFRLYFPLVEKPEDYSGNSTILQK